jgi:integrase
MATAKRAPRRARLTTLIVDKAAPATASYLIWDERQPNLALRVRPSGRRTWVVIYSRSGRSRWLHLGDVRVIGLGDARIMAAETMLAVAKGADPAAEKRAQRNAGTFADLHQQYLDQHARKRNKSWRQADALMRRHVLPWWAKLLTASIGRADVKVMLARIGAPIAANQTLAAASAVFSWGVAEDIVPTNPCRGIARNPTTNRERVLAETEIGPFWRALDDVDPAHAIALRITFLTGQRPGEVRHMCREHIKDGWWELPGKPMLEARWPGTKNGATHRVWLPVAAQTIIADWTDDGEDTGFVFAAPGGGPVTNLHRSAAEVCCKLGIERTTPHDLRRTHGSTITGLGFGRDAMNRIQNHREGGIADVYDQHKYAEENKRIMEAVATRILSLVNGTSGTVVRFTGVRPNA